MSANPPLNYVMVDIKFSASFKWKFISLLFYFTIEFMQLLIMVKNEKFLKLLLNKLTLHDRINKL